MKYLAIILLLLSGVLANAQDKAFGTIKFDMKRSEVKKQINSNKEAHTINFGEISFTATTEKSTFEKGLLKVLYLRKNNYHLALPEVQAQALIKTINETFSSAGLALTYQHPNWEYPALVLAQPAAMVFKKDNNHIVVSVPVFYQGYSIKIHVYGAEAWQQKQTELKAAKQQTVEDVKEKF